ncbi:MAG: hypothetical protein ACI9XB_002238 [Gammaproteobacteria bacterium]|jgi:hypothetical protein
MNLKITLLLIIASCYSNSVKSQQFVNESNLWYLTDCCFSQGIFDCETHHYSFDETVVIDMVTYYKLNTNNLTPVFDIGQFYREESGVVYLKYNENEEEFIIYDFNLEEGDQLEIGNASSSFSLLIEVLSVDSITLISGEKRKRLKVVRAGDMNPFTYWIEGIGAELATMNPIYMLSQDCWNDFNCYHFEDNIEYQLGDCLLTNSEDLNIAENLFSSYPNPVLDQLTISKLGKKKIDSVEILDINGKLLLQESARNATTLNVSALKEGLYFLKVTFSNGKIGISKFIKQ